MRQNFTNGNTLLAAPWGAANNLILDLIGLGVYLLLSIIILWGVR